MDSPPIISEIVLRKRWRENTGLQNPVVSKFMLKMLRSESKFALIHIYAKNGSELNFSINKVLKYITSWRQNEIFLISGRIERFILCLGLVTLLQHFSWVWKFITAMDDMDITTSSEISFMFGFFFAVSHLFCFEMRMCTKDYCSDRDLNPGSSPWEGEMLSRTTPSERIKKDCGLHIKLMGKLVLPILMQTQ